MSLAWPHHQNQLGVTISVPPSIIATPGRLVHVAVEMNLKLQSVEYVVFDEADRSVRLDEVPLAGHGEVQQALRCPLSLPRRLFEMGFAEQLQEILARLPGGHQTVLFSATLPKLLVEFARAGEKRGADGSCRAGFWGWIQGLVAL